MAPQKTISSRHSPIWTGVTFAITSAVLFGASTPFAKLLLGSGASPWLLAGLLYLGSGIGLSVFHFGRRLFGLPRTEAALVHTDLPWLGLIVLFGGIVAPVLLMLGLTRTSASSAALLLNLEGLATMAIAWVVFRENVDRRLMLGAFAILTGALLLSWQGGPSGFGIGALAITGACVAWGIDNNLTRKLSAADPVQIALIKGLIAGSVNFALAMAIGAHLPSISALAGASIVGFLGYGVSLVLFVLGLRHLGTARTGALFLNSAIYRRRTCNCDVPRAFHIAALDRGRANGNWPVSPSGGSPQPRASARSYGSRACAYPRRASSAHP